MKTAELLSWLIVIWWAFASLKMILNLMMLHRLSEDLTDDPLPSLNVVIPARNEERDVEAAVVSQCNQDFPGLRVIVVEDRSTDRTPVILESLKSRFPNLTVVSGEDPPAGWMGKQNAMSLGLRQAEGELVLFVDADVPYRPGVLRRLAHEMARKNLDMLVVMGSMEASGLEPLLISTLFSFPLYGVSTFLVNYPRFKRAAFGFPSGMLVRRDALEAAGGIQAIRDNPIDDVALARLMKAYRGRFGLVTEFRGVRHRMYRGFREAVDGFSKYAYHALLGRPIPAALVVGWDLAVHTLPAVLFVMSLFFPPLKVLRLPALLSFLAGVLCNATTSLWARQPLWIALGFPFRPLAWSLVLIRSASGYYRHGLVWRGRTFQSEGNMDKRKTAPNGTRDM